MPIELSSILDPNIGLLAVASFVGCLVLLRLAKVYPRLQGRADDDSAVQATHSGLTPRVGGIAIFGALALCIPFAPQSMVMDYAAIILASAILFFVGLREDLGYHVSPRNRLLAVMAVSLLVVVLIGEWLPRIGVPYVDSALHLWVFGVPFTLFVAAGVANGFNLIDGVNGLASLTAMTAGLALAVIAYQAQYPPVVFLGVALALSVLGFFFVNFPFGWMFLGDAGAYTVGFVLCWFGIAIIVNVPQVSPWAILLTLLWPLADTLLAIIRRRRGSGGAMLPDRLHFHQLVMRALEINWLGRSKRDLANPLTTVVLAPFVIAPQIVGVLLWNANAAAFFAVICFLVLFFGAYNLLLKFTRRNRLR